MFVRTRSARADRWKLLAGCIVGVCQSLALGGATFSSATAKWTFDADTAGGSQQKSISIVPPAGSAMPVPPTYQLKQTYTSGASTATAFGSIGYIVNPTTATFTLAPGTGVVQNDPSNLYPGDSLLRVDFDGFFAPTAPSFGPPATGYVSIAIGGTVGVGGHSQFKGQVDFLNATTSALLRPTVKFDKLFTSVGSFAQTFTSSSLLNPSTIPTSTKIRVKGFFEFRASNAESPSGISPLDIEFGGAPPTATWYATHSALWSDAGNWTPPDGSVIDDPDHTIPTLPNGAGQRARLVPLGGVTPNMVLDQDVTLGALDIDAVGSFSLTSDGDAFSLNMRGGTDGATASIHARNLNGDSNQDITAPINLDSSLQVIADGTYQGPGASKPAAKVNFNRSINGNGNTGIVKSGRGAAALNASNSFIGGTVVGGGRLDANVEASLGSGSVLVTEGLLGYNAVHAVAAGAAIIADNGGQIDLGVVPAANEAFNVGSMGIISGNPGELSALSVSSGGNLQLATGATIAHETFDFGLAEGNPKNLSAASAQYIFGIASDFDSSVGPQRVITVGSESGTPWKGFGSDRFDRYFGTDPRSDHEIVQIAGAAELRALDETLILNGQLVSIVGTSSLTKTGKGAVALNNQNNNFRAPITVHEGKLLVNGFISGVTDLSVERDAVLGGTGVIDGPVNVEAGGILAPGDNTLSGHIGTLQVTSLNLNPDSQLEFELNDEAGLNDLLEIRGDLTLDGVLNLFDAGNFAPGDYTLLQFGGDLIDNGLELGFVPDDGLQYSLQAVQVGRAPTGGTLALTVTVPEPGSLTALGVALGAVALRRSRHRGVFKGR